MSVSLPSNFAVTTVLLLLTWKYRNLNDEIVPVSDEDAFAMGREMGTTEGVLVGISSGAALWAAVEQARRSENRGKNIVLLPDTGDRYLSTELYS